MKQSTSITPYDNFVGLAAIACDNIMVNGVAHNGFVLHMGFNVDWATRLFISWDGTRATQSKSLGVWGDWINIA